MFTGIIQGLGQLQAAYTNRLHIRFSSVLKSQIYGDLALGDSVAVDGVCLTVTEITPDGFWADVSPETLRRSTLGKVSTEQGWVNIETSLRVGGKIGGHFVTGHVDGMGCLQMVNQTDQAWELRFTAPREFQEEWQNYLARFLVSKGSIAVNGISLTVADCDASGSWFMVAIIPHTYLETNLQYLTPGDWVNLEGDILGKYVARFLGDRPRGKEVSDDHQEAIEFDLEFLAEHGYLIK
ncbi:MAG: riboflavin synthase [Microcystaceae cyanobacterium]